MPVYGPPECVDTEVLEPQLAGTVNLRPEVVSSEDTSPASQEPDMYSATELVPDIHDSVVLRPEIISAEEV